MKKNDYFEATCIDFSHEGKGVVKVDNFPYFVNDMIVGEKGQLKVIKVLKNYGVARLISLTKESPHRVSPKCSIYNSCGGCQLQHISTKGQLVFKTKRVKDCLERIGKSSVEVLPCLVMDDPWYYRNKVQVPVGQVNNRLVSGFYKQHSNDIVECEHCSIQNDLSNSVVSFTRGLLEKSKETAYNKETYKGNIRHILTKYGYTTGEMMLVIITRYQKLKDTEKLVKEITSKYPMVKTIIHNVNNEDSNVILGKKETILYGNGKIKDVLLGNTFEISLKSFYQINPIQVEVLYSKAIELAQVNEKDIVMDAYCGIGTIALSVAKKVKQVYGVEIIPQAIKDAKKNAQANGIKNTTFVCNDAGEFMQACVEKKQRIDVVFVDPPRKGCSPEFLQALVQLQPKKVVYVSCDVSTQARDIKILEEQGYQAIVAQPVDMFPQTYHVETVVLMSRVEK